MKRAAFAFLCAIVLACLAGASVAGTYQGVCGIAYSGATSDRGIAVNKNPGSAYYGYFYGVDSASAAVRIWKPDSDGTSATSYSNTGNKLSWATAPSGALLMHAFVGPDDTVWVADYGAKKIAIGPPDGAVTGGNLTELPITLTFKPRGVFATGSPTAVGTKVYVAEFESTSARNCEVFEFDGAAWNRVANLGAVVTNPWFVTVDSAGNSYWGSNSNADPAVKKVDASYTVVADWAISRPTWLPSWTVGGIACVHGPANQDCIYVSAYNKTSCLRFDMNGSYIDGYGSLSSGAPVGTWTMLAFSGPGGNSTVWCTADDANNTYVLVNYPSSVQAYKVHLQEPPQPPTGVQVSNDVYGQIRLSWTPPASGSNNPTQYRIYRGSASGAETFYASTTDAYPKWKDTAQGTTAGGPFYYTVKSYNGAGESAASDEVGPISVAASTAPAPGSLDVALSYSEVSKADSTNNPSYDTDWNLAAQFLTDRGIAYTVVSDADATSPSIENDDIAGHSLLVLATNRDMSSYTAQCIADYCNYSQGLVFSCYANAIANVAGVRQSDFLLKDVYRANASTMGSGGSPWVSDTKYRYLRQISTASEAAAIFAGLTGAAGEWDGAQMWNFNDYLVRAYTDGTASEVGKWYDAAGAQSIADPDDVGLVVGYADAGKTRVQSIYSGTYLWAQARGSFSATTLLENILGYLGVSFTPYSGGLSIPEAKLRADNAGVKVLGKVVTRQMSQLLYEPGPQTIRSNEVFYIEETDGASGIKVQLPDGATVSEGDIVSVAGQITSDQVQTSPAGSTVTRAKGERVLIPIEMTTATGGTIPDPFYVVGRAVGGATQGTQLGVTGGVGLNNTGLLVTVTGKMTLGYGMDPAGYIYFIIDDGSGYQIPTESVKGIKIIGGAPADAVDGDMISVTGVIGAEYVQNTDTPPATGVIPVIRMRSFETATKIPLPE